MMERGLLYYNISGVPLVIETKCVELVSSLLVPYLPFRTTGGEGGEPLVTFVTGVEVPMPVVSPIDGGAFEGGWSRVYRTAEGYFTEMELYGRMYLMRASADWCRVESDIDLTMEGSLLALNAFLIPPFGIQLLSLGGVKLHGSVTMLRGNALMFLGTSGTGKSTHSMLWRRYVEGAELLNDDEPIVRMLADGEVRVYGAPWSGKTHCFRNESARLNGLVLLQQSSENHLRKGSYSEALQALVMSASVLRVDSEQRNTMFDLLVGLAMKVPFYILECRADSGAVALTRPLIDR